MRSGRPAGRPAAPRAAFCSVCARAQKKMGVAGRPFSVHGDVCSSCSEDAVVPADVRLPTDDSYRKCLHTS